MSKEEKEASEGSPSKKEEEQQEAEPTSPSGAEATEQPPQQSNAAAAAAAAVETQEGGGFQGAASSSGPPPPPPGAAYYGGGNQGYPPWINPNFLPSYWNGGGGAQAAGGPPPPGWQGEGAYPTGFPPEQHMMQQGGGQQQHQATVNANEFREFLAWQQARSGVDKEGGVEDGAGEAAEEEGGKDGEEDDDDGKTKAVGSANRKPRKKKKKSETSDAAAKSLILLTNEANADASTIDTPWADLVKGAEFVCPQLRGDISDALFLAIGQFRPCGLTQDDRVGKYKNREIGFVGMCCKHCGGQPGFGRYFPGSYDSFLNGTNCEGIIKHIKTECRTVPQRVRDTVIELEVQEQQSPSRPRYGSRKRFFSYVWTKLRELKLPDASETPNDEIGFQAANEKETGDLPMEDIVKDSEIVSIKDRHLVSDTTLVAMAQMKICQVTEEDKIGRCKDHRIGFPGLCCRHCGGKAGKPGYGRYFPSSLRSLAQADSCQQIIKHITSKCTKCPQEIRSVILEMHLLEKSERIRYGSRKIFFRRVWGRLHGASGEDAVLDPVDEAAGDSKEAGKEDAADEEIPWEKVIDKSEVVSIQDRGLISDAQLAAIAQMNLCKLEESDRVGWFKNREIGFGGLCCKHCGGRPSFGRYFPNSVRSFAQTTSSQTIISHIALYCQQCPKDIRDIVLKLQRSENSTEGAVTLSNSMYGSRKVFFDRVWKRMHQDDEAIAKSGVAPPTPAEKKAVKGEGDTGGDEKEDKKRPAEETKDESKEDASATESEAEDKASKGKKKTADKEKSPKRAKLDPAQTAHV